MPNWMLIVLAFKALIIVLWVFLYVRYCLEPTVNLLKALVLIITLWDLLEVYWLVAV